MTLWNEHRAHPEQRLAAVLDDPAHTHEVARSTAAPMRYRVLDA